MLPSFRRFARWNGPVTKDRVEALKKNLAKPERLLELTIGGSVEESVHIDVDAQKRAALRYSERKLTRASNTVQREHRLAALHGLSKQQLRKAVQARERQIKVQSVNRSKTVMRTPKW